VGCDHCDTKGLSLQAKRLALGTVQFGLPYGVANHGGQVSLEEARGILALASERGLDTLDTAIAYGNSETQLGSIGVRHWRVVTKLPAMTSDVRDIESWVRTNVANSLKRLNVERLYGLLLHRSNDCLLGGRGAELLSTMNSLKQEGVVGKIGVSIYDPDELDALGNRVALDLVQAPFNVLDQRLKASGWLTRLKRWGAEVHIRSVFLQGLLLMKPENRPPKFSRWSTLWQEWDGWLAAAHLTPVKACVGFALAQNEIDRVVVGVDSVAQLSELMDIAEPCEAVPPVRLSTEDIDLLNPSRWSSF
jgi:aryl-alcohol dehydrogenase-like predicted oxidoreductase